MDMEIIRAMVREEVGKALADRDVVMATAIQRVSPWAAENWERATAEGVFDGTRPGGPLTREQAAVAFGRMGLLKGSV